MIIRLLSIAMLQYAACIALRAQVILTPMPSPAEVLRLEDIWRVNLTNTGTSPINATVVLSIKDGSYNMILSATMVNVLVRPGASDLQQIKSADAEIQFGSTASAHTLRRIGSLPYGEYIICYFLNDSKTNSLVGEHCAEKSIRPMLPPELLQPYDEEEIYVLRPLLLWKAPFPDTRDPIDYGLQLVEVKTGQAALEALERNRPLVSTRIRDQLQMVYPGGAPDLELGITYAWRINAKVGDFHLGTTEPWTFKVVEDKTRPQNDSYRILSAKPDGNLYIAKKGILRFAYQNRYGLEKLTYSVKSLSGVKSTDEASKAQTPEIKLSLGMNKIDLDLSKGLPLKAGNKYSLCIHHEHTNDQYIEFIYEN